jgi:3-hydroxymyristoyl/3-hydroxydecanoyl-(acyl carrier protein) dehydratase
MALKTLPYVLESQIDANICTLTLRVPVDLDYFRGHFAGVPVVPGVVLIRWAEYFARQQLGITGICRQLEGIKFKRLVRPETILQLTLTHRPDTGKLLFDYTDANTDISSGRLVFEVADD